jgi:PAS domain S-box-containing protein
MQTLETIRYMGERLQIAIVVGSVPEDGSGDIEILYANDRTAEIFGYESGEGMVGQDVRSLMPPDVARVHRGHVGGYVSQAQNKGTMALRRNSGRIIGSWRNLKGVRLDGSMVDLQGNVADIKGDGGRYFMAIFRDRTEEVARDNELQNALEEACESKQAAEKAAMEAEQARTEAETALRRQDDLSNQVSLLLNNMTTFRSHIRPDDKTIRGFAKRHWYGLTGLVTAAMTALVLTGMFANAPISLVERVLLVLCGVLGTSLAAVLMPRRSE